MDSLKEETDAKIKAVKDQMATAKAERKARLQKRADEIKSSYEARSAKLKEARRLAKEALTG